MTPLVVIHRALSSASPRLLGLTGPSGSGKTTTAEALGTFGYLMLHLGAPVYALAQQVLGREIDHDRDRKVLEQIAIDLRGRSRYAMVNTAAAEIERITSDPEAPAIIYDDVRTEDEASFIRSKGGIVIDLNVPAALRRQRLFARGVTEIASGPTERTPQGDLSIAIRAPHTPIEIAMTILSLSTRVAA
jgi:dephospho-CoA kinase